MMAVSESALQGGTMAMLSGLPTVAGRIPSTFGVSQTGTASYTIPIWTPPGARGIEPKLALVYASGTPDSLMGPGWGLDGLSTITRCNKTWVQDGAPAPVTLTTSDKFCLDGNRLRLTGGTYGSAGSTYQTELETFSKVTAQSTAGNGPSWFEVKGKDGLIYEYGNSSDSRVYGVGGATPYLWALNKVRDRQGNNLVISYLQTNGSFRPNVISYTQTPSTSTAYNYQVVFGYTTRSTVANINTYVAGGKVQQTYVLTSITAQMPIPMIGPITLRQYNIDYSTSPATQQPRVSAVQTCTTADCLKPTTIAYQDGSAGIASPTTSANTGATSGQMNRGRS